MYEESTPPQDPSFSFGKESLASSTSKSRNITPIPQSYYEGSDFTNSPNLSNTNTPRSFSSDLHSPTPPHLSTHSLNIHKATSNTLSTSTTSDISSNSISFTPTAFHNISDISTRSSSATSSPTPSIPIQTRNTLNNNATLTPSSNSSSYSTPPTHLNLRQDFGSPELDNCALVLSILYRAKRTHFDLSSSPESATMDDELCIHGAEYLTNH